MVLGSIVPVERGRRIILAGLDQGGHLVIMPLKDFDQHSGRNCKSQPFFTEIHNVNGLNIYDHFPFQSEDLTSEHVQVAIDLVGLFIVSFHLPGCCC